jgi:hypothetical protein
MWAFQAHGLVDMQVYDVHQFMGKGMSLLFTMVPPTPANKMTIIVKCTLDHLRLTFHDTNHKRILGWFRKRMEKQLRGVMEKSIELYLATQLTKFVDACHFMYQNFMGPMEPLEELVGSNVEQLLKAMGFATDTTQKQYDYSEEPETMQQASLPATDPSVYPWATKAYNVSF